MPCRRSFLELTGAVGAAGLTAGGIAADDTAERLEDLELPREEERPLVRVVATGGTIASTEAAADGPGYRLSEDAEEIVEAVPLLDRFVDVEIERVARKGSPRLLVEDYVAVARAARRAEADGADGVVVTHGTDALEEDAFFNDLVLDLDVPVVFVGAMRAADATSADGPSNLLTAVRLIAREEFHPTDGPSGVYVAMNETIHAARDATKTHSTRVDAFESGPAGPIAAFTDDRLLRYREPGSYSADLSECDLDAAAELTVPIVTTGAGVDARQIEAAVSGTYDVDGIAVQTAGRGGMAPALREATGEALEAGIPVVLGTRVHYGPLAPHDEEGGPVTMEDLPAWKARLHLIAALTLSDDLEEIRATAAGNEYGERVVAPSTLR